MKTKPILRGELACHDKPNWQPLLDLIEKATHPLMSIDDWMWMYSVDADNGRRFEGYKHYWTRRYLHLTDDGRAYAYIGDNRYREVDRLLQLDEALEDLDVLYYPPRDGHQVGPEESRPAPAA